MKITLSPSLIAISSANLIFLYSTLKGEYNPFPFGCSIFTSGFFTVISVPDFVISVDLFSTFGVSAALVVAFAASVAFVAGVAVVVVASVAPSSRAAGVDAGLLATGSTSAAGVLMGIAVAVLSAVVEVSDAVSAAVVAASVAEVVVFVAVVVVTSGVVTTGAVGVDAESGVF